MALLSALLVSLPLFGATQATSPAAPTKAEVEKPSRAVELSQTAAAMTGIAISPLLGTGVYGAYKYIKADEAGRASLPWFAHPGFFMTALLIAGVCAAKDTFGIAFPPGFKKPLDVIEVLENKMSGLVAAGAVVPITMDSVSRMIIGHSSALPGVQLPDGLAMLNLGALDFHWVLNVLTVPAGMVIFAMVWMVSHAINVLILISPWGAIDAALKAARLSVLGLITVTTQLDPKSGGVLCLLIVIAAYFLSGWAFRLTTFGTLFCWDFFTRRSRRFELSATANKMFTSSLLVTKKLPLRTYGYLVRGVNGQHVFRYRPWLLLPEREVPVNTAGAYVGQGVFFSSVYLEEKAHFTLPPRYLGHERAVAELYGMAGVQEAGLRKAWSWLKEGLGLGRKPAAVAPA
jgi:hypothetical protein